MDAQALPPAPPRRIASAWPWLALALAVVPAVWHVVDFPEDVDDEFPGVVRPTFNAMPPPAYRLAEPGDTIDRVAIYAASAAAAVAAIGLIRSRRGVGLWPAALGIALAGVWQASTPGPTFDGWHGLGFRVTLDATAPATARIGVGAIGFVLATLVGMNLIVLRKGIRRLCTRGLDLKIRGLLAAATVLTLARQFEIPGVEPVGYWPRWAFAWGMIALGLALLRVLAGQNLPGFFGRVAWSAAGGLGWAGLVAMGVGLSWYHRPIDRLKVVEPGRIYMSAMPTYEGLKVAHERHRFRTIVNLFPEDTDQRSPLLPQEERFVREHGLRYIRTSAVHNNSDAFLDMTLDLARDPSAWPILIHCHGCMDRTPAWVGIYRFVVQGRPLAAILREIEAHRGYRPKASITLLYNKILEPRAPERYRADPTARLLRECARGNVLPTREEAPAVARAVDPPSRP